jgi:hypothetical protein
MIRERREKHETPLWASDRLLTVGGLNRFGEPNYRVNWGWNLLDFIGGKFEDRDPSGHLLREVLEMRHEPKYPMFLNRWIVEKWQPPEKYGTPESWYRQTCDWREEGDIPQLGPYPRRGRYDLACVLDVGGRFVQLTPTILEDVIRAVIYKQAHIASLAELKQAQTEKEKRWMQESRDFLERPAFNANEFVTVA